MSFLEENGIMVVNDWQPHSFDLNVIENVWKMLGDKREGKEFMNLNDLWSFLKNFSPFRTTTFKNYLNPSRDGLGPFSNIEAIPLKFDFLSVYFISF